MAVLWVDHAGNQTAPSHPSAPVAMSWYGDIGITILSGLESSLFPKCPMQAVPVVCNNV